MGLTELIQKLLEHAATNRDAVVNALKESAQPIWQAIWQAGHDKAYADRKEGERTLTAQVTELQQQLAAEKTERVKAESSKPDVAAVHEQYRQQILDLEAKHATKLKNMEETALSAHRTNVQQRIETKLTSGIDGKKLAPAIARVIAKDLIDRADVKLDGSYTVRQKGQKDAVIAAPSGTDVLDLLAKEVFDDPENKPLVLSGVESGSGTRANEGGGAGSKDALTRQREAMAAEARAAESRNPLAGAMGRSAPATL